MQLMDEQTRKEVEEMAELCEETAAALAIEEQRRGHVLLAAFLREALAREAEHDQLVTPEWLDGAEGKRLGFERFLIDEWGTPISEGEGEVRVEVGKNGGWLVTVDGNGDGAVLVRGVPTIRQVRLAVELATGRR